MKAITAIEILKQLDPNTEVGLWLGTQVPSQPIPSWPAMPQQPFQYVPQPYTITCKNEAQAH